MIGRIAVTDITPVVSGGEWPARAVSGEVVTIGATVFREGHDLVAADVVIKPPGGKARRVPMHQAEDVDRFEAQVCLDEQGLWSFSVEGYADDVATLTHALEVKEAAGQDTSNERQLLDEARARRGAKARPLASCSPKHRIWVDRPRALYGAWYELFPRSEGAQLPDPGHDGVQPPVSGTFRTAMERLPAVAEMGFDVLYLPPIHPIGTSFRKGPNNTLTPGAFDPGSPWAIGSAEGGHDAIHPDLGTFADFDAFVQRAGELGLEIALDLALQCSPDHPWVSAHPEWFTTLPDGTIAYAENPPKKYQDIYPINFDNDPEGIFAEVERIVRLWMSHGVRVFRVDNPHTKPVAFWERLIAAIKATDPDVVFLAEAFTKPTMMHLLAKVGFHQSYTYFTWRTGREELEDYLTDLSTSPTADYMRPNFFVNTPDILHASLQYGGPAMFKVRAVLAALLSPSWGVYAGYELYEHVAVKEGSEEYLDSEKYQLRPRDWKAAESEGRTLAPYIAMLNRVRREHPALHWIRNLRFHSPDNPDVMAWSKTQGEDRVLVVVNLNSHEVREATVHLDLAALGLEPDQGLLVTDLVTGASYEWGASNYVRLDPAVEPAHVFVVTPR